MHTYVCMHKCRKCIQLVTYVCKFSQNVYFILLKCMYYFEIRFQKEMNVIPHILQFHSVQE